MSIRLYLKLNFTDVPATELPVPNLPSLSTTTPISIPGTAELASKPAQRPRTPPSTQTSPRKPQTLRKQSIEDDPWGSPDLHRGHSHSSPPKTNGTSKPIANGIHEPVRTTSAFTTHSVDDSTNGDTSKPPAEAPITPGSLWGSYDAGSSGSFSNAADSGLGGIGFGGDSGEGGQDPPAPAAPVRSFGGGRVTGNGVEENISITLLPEKEGMFMFQHHNYQVSSSRRGSKVVRRYSDFVWLLDCLQKRFPFRQLPLLPPKRVGGMCSPSYGYHHANENSKWKPFSN